MSDVYVPCIIIIPYSWLSDPNCSVYVASGSVDVFLTGAFVPDVSAIHYFI